MLRRRCKAKRISTIGPIARNSSDQNDSPMITSLLILLSLLAADPKAKTAKEAIPAEPDDVLVLYNEHNSRWNTSGAKLVNIYLGLRGKVVWQQKDVHLAWTENEDLVTKLAVPKRKYDTIRVEVVEWNAASGGLSEIELWQRGKNIALGKLAYASKLHRPNDKRTGQNVTDGIKTSRTEFRGYWMLPDGEEGWVEIDLTQPAPVAQ